MVNIFVFYKNKKALFVFFLFSKNGNIKSKFEGELMSMRILVMSNLYDVVYDEIGRSLIDKKDDYDAIVLLGNIDINTLKYIKYTLSQNSISKYIFGVEGNRDSEGTLEDIGIKNIHMKCEFVNNKKFVGFSGLTKLNELSIYPTSIQNQVYEPLDTLDECDILISHSSPQGCEENLIQSGFGVLNEYIDRSKPYLCIYAYEHTNSISLIKNTYVIGVYGINIIDLDEFTITRLY